MKIYDFTLAPNPLRLRVYLAEKGIEVEMVQVNMLRGEHRTEAFRQKNPMRALPVLELDDGRCFSESYAIIEYFEERYPSPPMIGTTPEERLRVRALERICELGVLSNVGLVFQHTNPFFGSRIEPSEGAAKAGHARLLEALGVLDERIGEQPFVCGENPTVADCTLYAALRFARLVDVGLDLQSKPHIQRWYEAFGRRPSASA